MPTLDTVPAEAAPVHLLLIGDTKVGKSSYAAEAAIDGFELIYIDADNGLSALRARIKKEPNAEEVFKRVNYFAPGKPVAFTQAFLRSTAAKPMFWLPNRDKEAPSNVDVLKKDYVDVNPAEPLWVVDSSAIPRTTILALDSWTSFAADSLELLRPEQRSALLDGSADQSLYGSARIGLVYITQMLQRVQYHVIVQAHSTRYEIYEKPKGSSGAPKQRDMTLVETLKVPVSSSRAHGLEMASRFNHIGVMSVSNLGVEELDFTRKPNQVSGGPPNKKAKARDLGFKTLVGEQGVDKPDRPWYYETTIAEHHAALVKAKGVKK